MSLRFLIDECLSPELLDAAIEAGHTESTCVRNRGWLGLKDHELMRHVIDGDFTLVTCNSKDFRGLANDGPGGLHRREEIHAGLICLNSTYSMDIPRQHRLFRAVLDEVAPREALINLALEIFEDADGGLELVEYEIPSA